MMKMYVIRLIVLAEVKEVIKNTSAHKSDINTNQ